MHGRVSAQSADFFGHVGKSRFRCAGPANAASRMNKQGKDPAGSYLIFNHATHFASGAPGGVRDPCPITSVPMNIHSASTRPVRRWFHSPRRCFSRISCWYLSSGFGTPRKAISYQSAARSFSMDHGNMTAAAVVHVELGAFVIWIEHTELDHGFFLSCCRDPVVRSEDSACMSFSSTIRSSGDYSAGESSETLQLASTHKPIISKSPYLPCRYATAL